MSQAQALHVDRSVASSINPLIGKIFTEDTLCQVSAVVSDIGYLLSAIANDKAGCETEFRNLFLFCSVISAAIDYEISNPRLAGASITPKGK